MLRSAHWHVPATKIGTKLQQDFSSFLASSSSSPCGLSASKPSEEKAHHDRNTLSASVVRGPAGGKLHQSKPAAPDGRGPTLGAGPLGPPAAASGLAIPTVHARVKHPPSGVPPPAVLRQTAAAFAIQNDGRGAGAAHGRRVGRRRRRPLPDGSRGRAAATSGAGHGGARRAAARGAERRGVAGGRARRGSGRGRDAGVRGGQGRAGAAHRRARVPGARAPLRRAGPRVLRRRVRVRGHGRAPQARRRRRVQERAPPPPRVPARRLQGPRRLPPQQRLLRARGRREQRGDEQAGAGAAGPAPLRRRRRPPRLQQVPRAPGEGDAAQGQPRPDDARARQRGAHQAENGRAVRRRRKQAAPPAAVDGGSSSSKSGRSWRRRRRPRGARPEAAAQRRAGGGHDDDDVASRAVGIRLLAVAVQASCRLRVCVSSVACNCAC